MPAMHLVSTDLPAPLSPQSAVTCPAGTSRSTLVRAWTAPKCLSRPRILSSGSSAIWLDNLSPCVSMSSGRRRAVVARRRRISYLGWVYGVMPAAEQVAAPTAVHSADADTNLSLITVAAMFADVTHIGA